MSLVGSYKPERYQRNKAQMNAAHQKWVEANREKVRANHRAWYAANREKATADARARYAADPARQQIQKRAKKYGLTPEMVAEYLDAQEGACALCGEQLVARFSVDHDHATGSVRGLVHQGCNVFIGMFEKYGDEVVSYLSNSKIGRLN